MSQVATDVPKVSQKLSKIALSTEFLEEDQKRPSMPAKETDDTDEPDWDEVYKSTLPDGQDPSERFEIYLNF
jgi:hypothetical protein